MKFIPLTFDLSAKFFFHSDRVIVKRFLEAVLNIKVNDYELLENELPVTNFKEYHMTTDIVLKVNGELIVNIEINRTYFKNVLNKSLNYLGKFITIRVTRGDDVEDPKYNIIQLNLNAESYINDKAKRVVRLMYEDSNEIFVENIKMIISNIDKYSKMYYNGDRSDEVAFIAIFEADSFEKLDEMLKGRIPDKNRINFIRRYKEMCGKPEIITAYEKEMGERTVINSMMENATNDGIEQGIELGIEQGVAQEKEQMVKLMLKEKIPYDTISKVSGLTIEAIKKLENQE